MSSFIISEKQSNTQLITLNNPKALNALNSTLLVELREALELALNDEQVKGIVLTGKGEKAFAAGADISEFPSFGAKEAEELSEKGQSLFQFIEQAPKPIIAAVNGYALGGGCELALACHMRVASENARFGLPEVKLGIIPGYGGTQRLPLLVGMGKAIEIIITGTPIDAAEALRIGLVNAVCPLPELLDRSIGILAQSYRNSPLAVAYALQAVQTASAPETGYHIERKLFGQAMASKDAKEGVNAFLEKRAPHFTGK
ncbi:MAG: enoyl-CoA hydratase-related protein [Bacteroidota bacterium]